MDLVGTVEHEAIIIREIVHRVQADESIHGIVDDLNARAIPTATGDDRQLLVHLARQFGEGKFSEAEWLAMREPIERRVRAMEEQQADQPNQALMNAPMSFREKYGHFTLDQLKELEDAGEQIEMPMSVWLSWSPKLRRQVLRLIIDRGMLKPATERRRTARGTAESRVSVAFK